MRAPQEPESTTIFSLLDTSNFIFYCRYVDFFNNYRFRSRLKKNYIIYFFIVFIKGPLKLVQLRSVDMRNRRMMEAVTSLCPHLQEVQFCFQENVIPDRDRLSAQDLKSMLTREKLNPNSCWSNVISNNFKIRF